MRVAIASMLALAGCYESRCEQIQAQVDWQPKAGTFDVDLVFGNVGKAMFDCDDVDTCGAAIRRALEVLPVGDVRSAEGGFGLAHDLAQDAARDVRGVLERRGDELDLHVWFEATPTSVSGMMTDVSTVEYGRSGKLRLMVFLAAGGSFEPMSGDRFVYRTDYAGKDETIEWWVLPAGVRSVRIVQPVYPEITPLFEAVPGLEDALEAAGLIPDDHDADRVLSAAAG